MRTLLLLVRALTLVSTADAGIERRTPERGLWFDMSPYNTTVDPATVRELHVIFSNHLDIGFNSRAWCYNGEYNGCIGPNLTIDGQLCRPWSYAVLNANLNTFIPRALALANASRGGNTSFSYMTQPYVASLLLDCAAAGLVDWREGSTGRPLLECPNASTVKAFKAAVSAGDVWWHAFPHNPMPGLYDASLFNASLRMASRLADDLGVRRPTTYSQRDETGLTRAALPLLVAAGVGMISLGSGGATGGHPLVPDLFVWKDEATGAEVLFAHDHGYGGGVHVLPDGVALYCAWNTDNGGPLNATQVHDVYTALRQAYPQARVRASSFDAFYDAFAALAPAERAALPVVTREIGDTWLYGAPSDPLKNTQFREISRLRRQCVEEGTCDPEALTMRRFDRLLTKVPEHTWGEDTTWYLADNVNWTNAQTRPLLSAPAPNYQMAVESWIDQRNYLTSGVRLLELSAEAPYTALAQQIRHNLAAIAPSRPDADSLEAEGFVAAAGTAEQQSARTFECAGWELGFGMDASLARLGVRDTTAAMGPAQRGQSDGRTDGRTDGSMPVPTTPLLHLLSGDKASLGRFVYQTLSADDFDRFDQDYGFEGCNATSEDPGCHNFNKPNMTSARPQHREIAPQLVQIWSRASLAAGERAANDAAGSEGRDAGCTFVVQGAMPAALHEAVGAPDTVWLTLKLDAHAEQPAARPASQSASLHFDVQWFNKTATRLAEASWVSFSPSVRDYTSGWRLRGFRTGLAHERADEGIDPANVVAHGATHLHSLGPLATVEYRGAIDPGALQANDGEVKLVLASLDAPIVSAGVLSPFPTPSSNASIGANLSSGMHWNVQNNIWNTNFPQWYPFVPEDADSRFRFTMDVAVESRRS